MKFEKKTDKYRRERGGNSRFLEILCAECGTRVLIYQKDGNGGLFRCYLNRIFFPEQYASLQETARDTKDMPNLACECGAIIGVPMRHTDDRLAFRLIHDRFGKKLFHQ